MRMNGADDTACEEHVSHEGRMGMCTALCNVLAPRSERCGDAAPRDTGPGRRARTYDV